MTLAADWLYSKTFWLALGTTLGVAAMCLRDKRPPTEAEVGAVIAAWMAFSHRDAMMKALSGTSPTQPGAVPVVPETITRRDLMP